MWLVHLHVDGNIEFESLKPGTQGVFMLGKPINEYCEI